MSIKRTIIIPAILALSTAGSVATITTTAAVAAATPTAAHAVHAAPAYYYFA